MSSNNINNFPSIEEIITGYVKRITMRLNSILAIVKSIATTLGQNLSQDVI